MPINSRIFVTRSKNDKCKPFGSLYDGEYISYLSTRDSVSDMAQTNDVVCSDRDDNGNGGKLLPLIDGCSFFMDTNNNSKNFNNASNNNNRSWQKSRISNRNTNETEDDYQENQVRISDFLLLHNENRQ